jgi:N-acetylglucosamine kinase-like BadF-type ATPase
MGQGLGGQSNHVKGPEGRTRLIRAVTEALSGACRQAGLSMSTIEFDSACLGFTGGIEDKEPILREIVPCRRLRIMDDVTIALTGAHEDRPGIIVIAGTGSVAMGRNAEGRTARAGGWGYAFGDEGGAWGIVRDALRAALRWHEEWGPPTLLHDLLLQQTGEADIHVLRRQFYTEDYPRPRVAAFSKLVEEAAQQGDTIALGILNDAAQSLVNLVHVVHRRLFASAEAIPVAPIGGVFESRTVRERFQSMLEANAVCIVQPRHEPAVGALLEAIRMGSK